LAENKRISVEFRCPPHFRIRCALNALSSLSSVSCINHFGPLRLLANRQLLFMWRWAKTKAALCVRLGNSGKILYETVCFVFEYLIRCKVALYPLFIHNPQLSRLKLQDVKFYKVSASWNVPHCILVQGYKSSGGIFCFHLPVWGWTQQISPKRRCVSANIPEYRGACKSLARPGRKQATATEDFDFHLSYLVS
jgi:hypothetical protein